MPSQTYLILRRPLWGRLEGRTIVMQPAIFDFFTSSFAGATIDGQLMARPRGVNLSEPRRLMAGNEMTARECEVATRPDIVFAEHDGVSLLGNLYLPKGLGKAPVLVGVHGGGWQLGDRKFYTHWGNYLARSG